MRLFGIVNGAIDRFDRAQYQMPPFDYAAETEIHSGPFWCVERATFNPGARAAMTYHPGAATSQAHVPGHVVAQAFTPGPVVAQIAINGPAQINP